MKKTLIALAALAAAGAASAQSSVTLFGVLDVGYERVTTKAGSISGLAPSANSSSRLGFRGVEDLGGGMSASFWLEAALNPASGIGSSGTTTTNQTSNIAAGGLTFNRRSTVSLSGPFGELRLGRDYTPTFWNYTIFDPFGTNSVGTILSAYSGSGMSNTFVRASNSVGYFLPSNLGGIYGQAMYAMGNRASTETQARPVAYGVTPVGTEDNGRYYGGRIGYAQGPINTALSYAKTSFEAGTNAVSVGGFTGTSGDFTDLSWGGSYNFGIVKAMATYSRQKIDDVNAPGVNAKATGYSLGGDFGVGAGNILAEYSTVKLDTFGGNARGRKYSIGYVHNLSKRTALYAIGAHVTNGGGAAFTAASFSSGALGAVAGAANVNNSSNGYNVGLRHAF
jgi:predicted porin